MLLVGCGKSFHSNRCPHYHPIPGPTGPQGPPGSGVPVSIYDPSNDGVVPIYCGEETFTSTPLALGNILTQNGWSSGNNSLFFSEAVVNAGSGACRGTGAWRIDSTIASNSFGNQTASPQMTETAGESNLRSTNGGDTMETTFFFKSVSSSGDGSILEVDFARPDAGDRHNFLEIVNSTDYRGFFMYTNAPYVAGIPSVYHITRNEWHHVRMININRDGFNVDGTGNDIVRVYIDGVHVMESTSYEARRRAGQLSGPAPSESYAVNRMYFRLSTVVPGSQGFLIDDFKTKIYNRSNPTDVKAIYQTGFEQ